MPDNSAEIGELEEILQAGATRVVVDGQAVTYDFDKIEKRIVQLKATDTATLAAGKVRPRIMRANLTGF